MESEQFTTYREKNSGTSSLEEESEDSSSSDEEKQSSEEDSTFGDTRLADEETEQLVTEILQVTIEKQDHEIITERVIFLIDIRIQSITKNVANNVV